MRISIAGAVAPLLGACAVTLAAAVPALLAQDGVQAPASYSPADAPAALKPAVERAMQTFDALQAALSKRVMEEMAAGGPPRAIVVCRDEAPVLTSRIAADAGISIGRTSDRLRNPSNAPRPWARAWVERASGRKAAAVEPVVVDLGRTVGVLRPIGTIGVCTTCHGSDARRPAAIQQVLSTHYPGDRATGFEEGDLRGFFWAEVPKTR